jgi:UDP-N-acetylmuramoylalanine--D-glutamate ligase
MSRMCFEGCKVLVVGMARSGLAAVRLLSSRGAEVIANDIKSITELSGSAAELSGRSNVHLELGIPADSLVNQAEAVFISPGVPIDSTFVKLAGKLGKPVIGELELGFMLISAPIVAITGTNGKTTTTALTGLMFKRDGICTHILGNIGDPLSAHVDDIKPEDVVVLEVSSFQLESIHAFRPKVSVVLNITPDHLNRHHTMENYTDMKARIFENQRGDDMLILNWDDPPTRALASRARCSVSYFSRKEEVPAGCFIRDGRITWKSLDGRELAMGRPEEVRIPGEHNLENALAASAAALSMGVSPIAVRHSLAAFEGVEHRLEFVVEAQGIRFINDSKGTNPDASIKAVRAMSLPTIIIAGGYDKHTGFDDFIASFACSKVAGMVVIGDTADQLADSATAKGFKPVVYARTFKEAVYAAYEMARPGYNVLLSPACASFGMFDDFEQRGRIFKQIAMEIAVEAGRK